MDRGEIFWIDFGEPGGAGAQAFDRPAIILADDQRLDRLIVLPLSARPRHDGKYGVIRVDPDSNNGLPSVSYALVYHIQPAYRNAVRRRSGRLSKPDFVRVENTVKEIFGFK